jgi:hypothetical protein
MTRSNRFRFLILAGAAGAALTLGSAVPAFAATSGQPYPSPSPTVRSSYPPPEHHKHHPKPVTHCFLSLETEHDTLSGQPVGQQDQQYGQQQNAKHDEATIEVVQLVRVCVTTERGHADVVKVKDETGPFAWEIPADGYAPTPHGLPADVGSMYTQQAS